MSNIIVMAFLPQNIVGCLLKKGLQRGGHGHPRTPPRYALVLVYKNGNLNSGDVLTCDQAFFFRGSAKEKQRETRRSVGVSQALARREKSAPDTFTARVVCRQSRIWTFV